MPDTPIADDVETDTGIAVYDEDFLGIDEALAHTADTIERWGRENRR
jgi:hypothetical protein